MPGGRALPGAVGALCRAMPPRARLVPEALRRAKLDRPQATLDFWRLLYALLKQIHGGKWSEADAIDTQIRFVKSALWYHGYGRPDLHRLPSDGSAGSRELLLAFSWLLHRISLLEQLLARNRVRTGDETSVCMCEDDLSQSEQGTTEIAPEYGPEDRVDVRYLQWLNGRLRFQWRSLHAQHQEQCKLLHKIHLLTSGSHVDQILGHFSVTEMDLIRQPENYKQLVQLLELETMQLEAFLEWKQLEPVYWQWMETVLDNMAEGGNMCKPQDAHIEKSRLPKATSCCPWADSLTGQINKLSRDLMALRDQLHELVTHRKSAWEEKPAERRRLISLQRQFPAGPCEPVLLRVRGLGKEVTSEMLELGDEAKSLGAHVKDDREGSPRALVVPSNEAVKCNNVFGILEEKRHMTYLYQQRCDLNVGLSYSYLCSFPFSPRSLSVSDACLLAESARYTWRWRARRAAPVAGGMPPSAVLGMLPCPGEQLRASQVKARAEDLQKEDFAATVRKIQEAVELKLLDLSNLCAPKKNKVHGLCRLVYRSKHSASKIGFSRSVSKEPAPAVSATEVIRELQMREASLQRELKQLREECRQRLDEIAEGLDGVICISP